METVSQFSSRWMKVISSTENTTVASDALVSGLSAWSSVVADDAGWRLLTVETHQHWSALSVIMCCQGQQSSQTLGEAIRMSRSLTTGYMITHSLCTLVSLLIQYTGTFTQKPLKDCGCKQNVNSGFRVVQVAVSSPATWLPFNGATVTNGTFSAVICKCCAPITIFSSRCERFVK